MHHTVGGGMARWPGGLRKAGPLLTSDRQVAILFGSERECEVVPGLLSTSTKCPSCMGVTIMRAQRTKQDTPLLLLPPLRPKSFRSLHLPRTGVDGEWANVGMRVWVPVRLRESANATSPTTRDAEPQITLTIWASTILGDRRAIEKWRAEAMLPLLSLAVRAGAGAHKVTPAHVDIHSH
jgi:hypothetical protein